MTPAQFVAKWQAVNLSERSACQQHFHLDRFEIHTNFTGTIKKVFAFDLDGLVDAANLDKLRRLFTEPDLLRPGLTTQSVTKFLSASATCAPWRGEPRNTVINYRKSNSITSAVHFPA